MPVHCTYKIILRNIRKMLTYYYLSGKTVIRCFYCVTSLAETAKLCICSRKFSRLEK